MTPPRTGAALPSHGSLDLLGQAAAPLDVLHVKPPSSCLPPFVPARVCRGVSDAAPNEKTTDRRRCGSTAAQEAILGDAQTSPPGGNRVCQLILVSRLPFSLPQQPIPGLRPLHYLAICNLQTGQFHARIVSSWGKRGPVADDRSSPPCASPPCLPFVFSSVLGALLRWKQRQSIRPCG